MRVVDTASPVPIRPPWAVPMGMALSDYALSHYTYATLTLLFLSCLAASAPTRDNAYLIISVNSFCDTYRSRSRAKFQNTQATTLKIIIGHATMKKNKKKKKKKKEKETKAEKSKKKQKP
ncbi:hypothetical protein ACLKA6_002765 [Drosophila palustris]